MTDDQMQNVRDDIAFMRALATEGQRTPLLGGVILGSAGLIFAVASVVHWATVTGLIQLGQWGNLITWVGAMVIFFVILTIANIRIGSKPGARSPANKAAGAAWMGVGLAIFVMSMSYAAAAWQLRTGAVMATFPSLIFALYGAGWTVAASMTGKKWLWWVGIGSWVMAPVLAWLSSSPSQFLAYAAALILLMSIPGFVLMRQEPSDIV